MDNCPTYTTRGRLVQGLTLLISLLGTDSEGHNWLNGNCLSIILYTCHKFSMQNELGYLKVIIINNISSVPEFQISSKMLHIAFNKTDKNTINTTKQINIQESKMIVKTLLLLKQISLQHVSNIPNLPTQQNTRLGSVIAGCSMIGTACTLRPQSMRLQ